MIRFIAADVVVALNGERLGLISHIIGRISTWSAAPSTSSLSIYTHKRILFILQDCSLWICLRWRLHLLLNFIFLKLLYFTYRLFENFLDDLVVCWYWLLLPIYWLFRYLFTHLLYLAWMSRFSLISTSSTTYTLVRFVSINLISCKVINGCAHICINLSLLLW